MVPSFATRALEAKVPLEAEEAVGSGSQSNDEGCKHNGFHDVSEAEELRAPGDGVADDVHGDRDVRGADGVHVCARDVRVGAAPDDHDDDDGNHGGHFDVARGAHGGDAHGDHFGRVRSVHDAHDVRAGGALVGDDAHDFGGVHGTGGAFGHGVDDGGAVRGATLSYRPDWGGLGVATGRDVLPVGVVGPGFDGRMPGTTRRSAASFRSPVHGAVRQDRHGPIDLRVAGRSHVPHRGYPRANTRFDHEKKLYSG